MHKILLLYKMDWGSWFLFSVILRLRGYVKLATEITENIPIISVILRDCGKRQQKTVKMHILI